MQTLEIVRAFIPFFSLLPACPLDESIGLYDAKEEVGEIDGFVIDGGMFDVASRGHHQIAWLWLFRVDWGWGWIGIHHPLFFFTRGLWLLLTRAFGSVVAMSIGRCGWFGGLL